MLKHTMRMCSVAQSFLLRLMRKYADMRLSLNFFKNFIIIIFLAYNFISDKARDEARDKARDKTRDKANDKAGDKAYNTIKNYLKNI